jgi:hypothetical protein
MPTTFHPMDPMDQKKSSSEHQRMLGIADVKPVAEQDTDKSDAPELVLGTQAELDFKQQDITDWKAKFIDESKQMSTTVSSKILYKVTKAQKISNRATQVKRMGNIIKEAQEVVFDRKQRCSKHMRKVIENAAVHNRNIWDKNNHTKM